MIKVGDRIEASRDVGSPDLVRLVWTYNGSTWVGARQLPGVNNFKLLPSLNTREMLDIFRWIRDLQNRSLDPDLFD